MPAKEFEAQYKNYLSNFNSWDQKEHAEDWLLFPENADVSSILLKIPLEKRVVVKEVTLDMSNAMDSTIRKSFPNATIVTDRFHVQQLISEAVQEIRIALRRGTTKEENKRQLLARSNYLLFKPENRWHEQQKERADILFKEFPILKHAYNLAMNFRSVYEQSKTIDEAKKKLELWYEKIETENIEAFLIPTETIRLHEATILNYFINRSTNASAESFNAKLKGFRSLVRGVIDKKFFLFRIAKLYA
ncbi:MAG: transposase [Candidatus Falkowbacteria bacterium]|nr:transposase [Candidatus Falkowbacteria bacterium]